MNGSQGSSGRTVPPPARPHREEAGAGGGGDTRADPPSSRSGRPKSVREAATARRRYSGGANRRAVLRRRPEFVRTAPPPAREFADTIEPEAPSRRVEVGDEVWNLVVRGSATLGSGSGRGARLLSIGFEAPGDGPDPGDTRYLVADELDDVDEDMLRGLVAEVARRSPAAPGSSSRSRSPARGRRFRRRGR